MSDTNTTDESRTYQADEVRRLLDEIPHFGHTDNVPETIERFVKMVVEEGTFWPHGRVTADLSLTLWERISGKREQDVTAILCVGMVLGAALERDIPSDDPKEDAWRDGQFELPDDSPETTEEPTDGA